MHGFTIMAVSCLMVESLESFCRGWEHSKGKRGELAFCHFFAALDLELYQLFYQGKGKPMTPKVTEPTRRNTREGALLKLFAQMPERDKQLFLGLAREAVKRQAKHE